MNLPLDTLPGRALVHDRELIRELYASRVRAGQPWDEVWDGLLVFMPLPDNDHQNLRVQLAMAIEKCHPHAVDPGVNVSDRVECWLSNFRCPDVVVYLPSNPAKPHGTHWVGGPDFAVEIIS